MTSNEVKREVLEHLMFDRKLQSGNADRIYQEATDLYHRLFTIVDYHEFDSINDQVLSALLVIIRENFQLNENFK
jgi:hypothetical protein